MATIVDVDHRCLVSHTRFFTCCFKLLFPICHLCEMAAKVPKKDGTWLHVHWFKANRLSFLKDRSIWWLQSSLPLLLRMIPWPVSRVASSFPPCIFQLSIPLTLTMVHHLAWLQTPVPFHQDHCLHHLLFLTLPWIHHLAALCKQFISMPLILTTFCEPVPRFTLLLLPCMSGHFNIAEFNDASGPVTTLPTAFTMSNFKDSSAAGPGASSGSSTTLHV